MAYISQINIDGTTYDLRDRTISGAMHFVGPTTTALTDGATTKPITVNGQSYTQDTGDVVLYDGKEFVWDGSKWILLGDEGSYVLKGDYVTDWATQGGYNDRPIFTQNNPLTTQGTIKIRIGDPPGKALVGIKDSTDSTYSPQILPTVTFMATVTPTGTVSTPTFNVQTGAVNISVKGTPNAYVDTPSFTGSATTHDHDITYMDTSSGTGNNRYRPSGVVATPTFYGKTVTLTWYKSYTPSGTVSKPAIDFSPQTATVVKGITTSAATLSAIASVSGEVLTIGKAVTSALASVTVNQTVDAIKYESASDITIQLHETPSFTGSPMTIGFGQDTANPGITYRPDGGVATPTFSGQTVMFDIQNATITPSGTISTPTFHGQTTTFTGDNTLVTGGSNVQPTFSGDSITINIAKRLQAVMDSDYSIQYGYVIPNGGTISTPTFHASSHSHGISLNTPVSA